MDVNDKSKRSIKNLVLYLLVLYSLFANFVGRGWIIYHENSFMGRVLDKETKEPVEGAVVVAVYNVREIYPGGSGTRGVDAHEVLTNKNGEFLIPQNKYIFLWPIAYGQKTDIIIFKPGYALADKFYNSISIFATDSFDVQYLQLDKINAVGTKKTMTYSEGLIFRGNSCKELLGHSNSLTVDSVFLPLDGAREKIKKLHIPLDCPKNGIPIPKNYDFTRETGNIKENYMVVELQRPDPSKWSSSPYSTSKFSPDDLPLYYKAMTEEEYKRHPNHRPLPKKPVETMPY